MVLTWGTEYGGLELCFCCIKCLRGGLPVSMLSLCHCMWLPWVFQADKSELVLFLELCLQCPSTMATSVSGKQCMLLQTGMTFHTCEVAAGECHRFTEVKPAWHAPEGKGISNPSVF